MEEYLLALALRSKKPAEVKVKVTTPAIKRIFARIRQAKRFSITSFFKALPEELKEIFSRLYLGELEKVSIKEEIERTVKELKKLELREKLKELAKKGDLEKFSLLSQKLKELEV